VERRFFITVAAALPLCLSLLVHAGAQTNPVNPQPPDFDNVSFVPVEFAPGRLNLRTGDVDTAALPNLLAAAPAAFDPEQRYVLQLHAPIDPTTRTALEGLGVRLGDYLPAWSYIVTLDGVNPAQLAASGLVNWLGPYQSDWKVAPEIGNRPYATAERQALAARDAVMVEVTLFRGLAAERATDAFGAIRGAVVQDVGFIDDQVVLVLEIPSASLLQLAAIDAVQFVDELAEVTLRNNGIRWIVQSNISGVTPFYNAGIRGQGQVVGVMDGRPSVNHCSFTDTQPIGPNHRKILAYNTTTTPVDSHGTHVTGTAVGDAGAFANTRGVAYLAKFVYNTISTSEAGVYGRLQTHHNQTARLHTNSWGNDGTTSYDGLCRGIDRFARDFEESLPVWAVTNLSTLRNPDNAKNLLAVGGSWNANSQHLHCTGGTGPTADGRRKPEVYAPGCTVTSSTGTACGTTGMQGTSMACPAVAGAGLLVRQYYVDGFYPTGAAVPSDGFVPSGALIKATLVNSAVDMTGVAGYPSNLEGWGRILLDESLHLSGQSRRMIVHDVRNGEGLSTGQIHTHNFIVDGPIKIKATLVFTDVAGTAGAANPVVNDLDLEVISPTNQVYKGNVFSGGLSITGGVKDNKNNVEQVHLLNPVQGEWTARVIGAAVNQQLQGYALVISGAVETEQPPPFNNTCDNPLIAGDGVTFLSNISATTSGFGEPACEEGGASLIQADVWFVYPASCDGNVTFSVCGSDFETMLAIYSGNCPTGPNQAVACDRNSCPDGRSQVTVAATAGELLYVRVGGRNGAQGEGLLTISCAAAPACPADLDGSGTVDVFDLLALLGAWGPCAGCPADLDGSGSVDVFDLLALLGAWGDC
jgi:hypothetical protein